jgi:hypothetical protein
MCRVPRSAVLLPGGRDKVHGHHLLPGGAGVRAHLLPAQQCVRQRRVQAAEEVRHDGESATLPAMHRLHEHGRRRAPKHAVAR